LISLSVLIPVMPGMGWMKMPGPKIPRLGGWKPCCLLPVYWHSGDSLEYDGSQVITRGKVLLQTGEGSIELGNLQQGVAIVRSSGCF
jgi:hypothetical protein